MIRKRGSIMEKKTSIRGKMMKIFAMLVMFTGIIIAALLFMFFWREYKSVLRSYLKDVDYQTTNSLENNIKKTEDFSLKILTSQVIQNAVNEVNKKQMNYYELLEYQKRIEKEIAVDALSSSYVVSVSVITDNECEFSVKKHEIGGTQFGFVKEEIYAGNGSLLWTTLKTKNRICAARAILDLETMQPIGYINIVYEKEYLTNILTDNFVEYVGVSYLVDDGGYIMAASDEKYTRKYLENTPDKLRDKEDISYDVLSGTRCYYYVGNRMENGWTLVQLASVKEFNKTMYWILQIIIIILIMTLGAGVLLVWLATSHIAKPTRILVESMKQLAKDGKYPRVQITSNDEIGWISTEYNKMAENIEEMIEKVYKMELSEKQARLEYLQMQINPHFLYNVLDTISWMAIAEGKQEISEMTIALAELLRAIIKNDHFITLREEMVVVKDYLMIQSERFEDKILVNYDIEEKAYEYLVPNFILQPLIENAIIHGLEPKVGVGRLGIQIKLIQDRMHFMIEDDGVGMTETEVHTLRQRCSQDRAGNAIGLINVYKRLILCYGEDSRLIIESKKDVGTKIRFSIPLRQI